MYLTNQFPEDIARGFLEVPILRFHKDGRGHMPVQPFQISPDPFRNESRLSGSSRDGREQPIHRSKDNIVPWLVGLRHGFATLCHINAPLATQTRFSTAGLDKITTVRTFSFIFARHRDRRVDIPMLSLILQWKFQQGLELWQMRWQEPFTRTRSFARSNQQSSG